MPVKDEKIYYISDVFRPDFVPCLPFINFIKEIISFPLQYAGLGRLNDDFIKTDKALKSINGFSAIKFLKLNSQSMADCLKFSKTIDTDEWARLFAAEPSCAAVEYLGRYLKDAKLIIGYETPPVLLKCFNILNIKYIDLRISSIKFFNDLIIGAKTNCPEIFAKMLPYKLPEEAIYYKANQMKARSQVHGKNNFSEYDFALICGQNKGDSSLIFDGKNHTIADFIPQIKRITSEHKLVYFKKHPSAPNTEEALFAKLGVKILPNELNMYDLLANPRLKKLYAISSGTLQEAKYFGKETEYFKNSIYDYISDEKNICFCEKYLNIFQHIMRPYFWASVLHGNTNKLMSEKDYEAINYESNLRKMLNLYWSYKG